MTRTSAFTTVMIGGAVAALTVVRLPLAAQSSGPRFPTNEDLRHTRAIGGPALSPDGRFAIVSVTEPTVDGATSHLWLVDIQANTSRQLTFAPPKSKSSETQGAWSADGRGVYFVSRRGDDTQLFRLPMDGGEAAPIPVRVVPPVDDSRAADAVDGSSPSAPQGPVDADVSRFALSPDGRLAALVVPDPVTPGERKQREEHADAHLVDHDTHGSRAYLLDLASSKVTPIAIPPDVSELVWAHGSGRLVVAGGAPNDADDLGPARRAWIVDVAHPDAPQALTVPPTVESIAWSPDDTQVFITAQSELDTPPGYADVFALSPPIGQWRDLTRDYRGTIDGLDEIDASGPIAAASNGLSRGFARVDPKTGVVAPLSLGRGIVSALATNARHTGYLYLRSSSDEPSALYYTTTLDQPGRRLSLPATAGDWRAVAARVVRWTSDENVNVDGLLYLPPQASTGKVPLIVCVHGGPTGAWADGYQPFTQFLVGLGWAVLQPNPRGSTGYGAAFAAANKNDLGGGDYRDIMAGVDAMIVREPIDPSKLGLYGYSYGGEMAGFVEGKTNRFKAIISAAPVIDQFSEYGTENGSWYDRWFFGKPWEHLEDAWRQSPLAGAAKASTPFLLLQGEDDTTDPAGQSEEMYRALRQAGVPVQLVLYPRENHGPLSVGISGAPSREPWHGFDARQRIAAFFAAAFKN